MDSGQPNRVLEARLAAGEHRTLIQWANLAVTCACLFDYFVADTPWALLTLALLVLLINGFGLLEQRSSLRRARQADEQDERETAELERRRAERLRARGLA